MVVADAEARIMISIKTSCDNYISRFKPTHFQKVLADSSRKRDEQRSSTELGIGWRPELALAISRRKDIKFVEIVTENYWHLKELPEALKSLLESGLEIIPHCISLSPGSAEKPDPGRIKKAARFAELCGAKLMSDHVCFVRAAGLESGHLLPVPKSKESMKILIENVRRIKAEADIPFALENIASPCRWQDSDYDEAEFFAELLEETDSLMLLDLANLYANAVNHGFDPLNYLNKLPLHRLAYVHVAGGTVKGRVYHDTHAHPVKTGVYALLKYLSEISHVPKVMLERDDNFQTEEELNQELDRIVWSCKSSSRR